ncbi:MAG: cation transport protein ChaC [Phenylobacterium sp.]|jgi:cation transport protein ChaC
MSHDTISANKSRQDLSCYQEIWLFAYGSLIYKVDFPYLASSQASIYGWQRRFWQGSHDHRGTVDAPGRVLTLIEHQHSECCGVAFQVTQEVFEHLDHREKNGYLRYEVDIHFNDNQVKPGLVYIAPKNNAAFLGPASEQAIAEHIEQSRGPSGENKDYALQLADALRALKINDPHVFAIEQALKNLASPNSLDKH